MNGKTIAILASLDTKGEEASFLRNLIEGRGHHALFVDTGTGRESSVKAEYPAKEVASAGGEDISVLRETKDSARSSACMIAGATKLLKGLAEQGKLDGIVAFGGTSNTTVGTSVMKNFPFGMPKAVLSSSVSVPALAAQFFGTKDIAILHSVVDVAGMNSLMEDLFKRTAGAISGMVEMQGGTPSSWKRSQTRATVCLTEFKFSDRCCAHLREILAKKEFAVIPFHAQGSGDRAMEDLLADGVFDAVVDMVPAAVAEEMFGGNRAAGPHRLEAAGKRGIPQIIAPCGFDMISCGPMDRADRGDPLWVSRELKKRKLFVPDAFRVQARTTAGEMREVAGEVARKLNMAKGPVVFVLPLKGFSSLDKEGMALYDPEADGAFIEEFRKSVDPKVQVVEVDANLDTEEFAEKVAELFLAMRDWSAS
ncbi:MAG: Tm-1-like ATP-binding domain-containing protein [Pseudomonadota bacterium]